MAASPAIKRWLAAALLVAVACSGEPSSEPSAEPTPPPTPAATSDGRPFVRFGDHTVRVEIADDAKERKTGLMHRSSLPADEGMLFVFPYRVRVFFWMKNTLIPLSIAFLRRRPDGGFTVVRILDMEPCRTPDPDDCPQYWPGTTYDAALEVNQGWFRSAGVAIGSSAVIGGMNADPR